MVELLLANKADINAKDKGGTTPLRVAAFAGHKDVVALLLANKADYDETFLTRPHLATWKRSRRCSKTILIWLTAKTPAA